MGRISRYRTELTFALVLLGPVLAALTFFGLGPLDQNPSMSFLRLILLADLVYVLVVATLILSTIARMVAARRARSAGSRLHLRLTVVFALVALVPTVLVAIFAGLTVNVGLEGWFSDRVRSVVGASINAAEAYQDDQRRELVDDTAALANFLESARRADFFLSDGELRQLLTQGQGLIQRGLREAYVIDGAGEIRARGERSYLFDYERPTDADIAAARQGEIRLIEDLAHNEYRALAPLSAFTDRFLYVSRQVDGDILALLDDAQETATLYTQLENQRGRLVFEFGLLYLAFAVLLILAAIAGGIWFAERLSRPVGRLAGAAQRVGAGDLDVRVPEEDGDDEIAMLGRVFNQMTGQLKVQREALLQNNRKIERRERLFDSVLSSVTSGVVGLDARGRIGFANRSAGRILGEDDIATKSIPLDVAIPEFGPLLERLRALRAEVAQEEVQVSRAGKLENLLVRIATRRTEQGRLEGYVIAFDDVTDLVTAQRMAAWGDVARRIAHEIKNPLTPIQLSAERIRRKYASLSEEERSAIEQLTDVIIRQTNDLRRIVDEFSKFARMPEPDRRVHDLVPLVRDAVVLQDTAFSHIDVSATLPTDPLMAEFDATMIGQALTNLIKNAGEAIESLEERGAPDGHVPTVRVRLTTSDDQILIRIADNGIGLPEDRARLFEPYVTTREKGTGLGLPIVKKIIEEHGGSLTLTDADPLDGTGHRGALAIVTLPLDPELENSKQHEPAD
ncbi:MAG: PAS domain-containing sensor histidine kinase [Pseudomonadota bacterium]